jgi:hypothetical protein
MPFSETHVQTGIFEVTRLVLKNKKLGCERASQGAFDFLSSLRPDTRRKSQPRLLSRSLALPPPPHAALLPAATIEEAPEAKRRGTPRQIRCRRRS